MFNIIHYYINANQSYNEISPHTSLNQAVQSLSRVRLFATPWTAAHQASLSITNSQSLLKLTPNGISLVAQTVKCLPTMQETRVRSLGWEDPPDKEMATHSSTLAWKSPWMEEPGRLQSKESQRVGHD